MADKFYRVAIEMHTAQWEGVNTFCIFGDDNYLDWTPLTAQGLADKIGGDGTLITKLKAALTTNVTVDAVLVREMLSPTDPSVPDAGAHTVGGAGTFTATAVGPPTQIVCILSEHTDAAVKSGHGHMAFPAAENYNVYKADGTFDPASAWWTALNAYITELQLYKKGGSKWAAGGHWGLGVYSRTRRARGLPQFAFSVTSITPRLSPRWLNSRQSNP